MLHSNNEDIIRCRPLLGTFVEIRAKGLPTVDLHSAVSKAFLMIERIDALMSYHKNTSELSDLNARAHISPVEVSEETYEVLKFAKHLFQLSQGAFDITVGRHLEKWGILSEHDTPASEVGTCEDMILNYDRTVTFNCPLRIDLGGVAKGFAVDKAIEVLKSCGVKSALVNAGGDLRAFGSRAYEIVFRDPNSPDSFAGSLQLDEGAIATSAPYFSLINNKEGKHSALVNPLTQTSFVDPVSVSVRAALCMVADSLTKVFMVSRDIGHAAAKSLEATLIEPSSA